MINVLIILYIYFIFNIENAKVLVIFYFEIILGNLVMVKMETEKWYLYYLSNISSIISLYFNKGPCIVLVWMIISFLPHYQLFYISEWSQLLSKNNFEIIL